jgi:NitT/TauT family transport system ATP-binding protein
MASVEVAQASGNRSASGAPLAVSASNVTMSFHVNDEELLVLEDFSLDLAPGEFLTLIGPSGCGKSTFLRLVADILAPKAGTIQVNGSSPHEARRGHAYSFVFQNPTLFPWLTLAKNVELALEITGSDRKTRAEIAADRIALVGLAGFENYRPRQLSGGMRQRAAIARALTSYPKLLLMDEPFGALDEITRERMNLELLSILSATGAAVLFVTHSIDEAVILSDRIVVLSPRPGRIKSIIPIDLPRPRDRETRFLPEFTSLAGRVRRALQDAS